MAFSKAKGTVIKMGVGTVYTTIAQVLDLDGPGAEAGAFEHDTLDNAAAAVPRTSTGSTLSGPVSGNLYFDPVLASQQTITDLLTTPASTVMKIVWSDTGVSEWLFTSVGFSFSPSAALGDGLKASFSMALNGLVTYL